MPGPADDDANHNGSTEKPLRIGLAIYLAQGNWDSSSLYRLGKAVARCGVEVNLRRNASSLRNKGGRTIITVMAKKLPFALVYADELKEHLRAIESQFHSLILSEIERQLLFDPEVETRNRKPLKRPISFGADWELRLGPENRFRVFYQVKPDSHQVRVLAIGVKDRNRLFIGGEEFAG